MTSLYKDIQDYFKYSENKKMINYEKGQFTSILLQLIARSRGVCPLEFFSQRESCINNGKCGGFEISNSFNASLKNFPNAASCNLFPPVFRFFGAGDLLSA